MHPSIVIGAIAGFIGGYFGYIFIRFTLLPLLAYKNLKKQTAGLIPAPTDEAVAPASDETRAREIRRLSEKWSDFCTDRLPGWYVQYLRQRRGEHPNHVAAQLMKLSTTRNPDHARRQMERVRGWLNMA